MIHDTTTRRVRDLACAVCLATAAAKHGTATRSGTFDAGADGNSDPVLIMGYGISMDVENLRFAVLTATRPSVARRGRSISPVPVTYRTAAAHQL